MDALKKRQEEKINLYKQHEYMIDSVQDALRREIPHLTHEFNLSIQQVHMLEEYIDDRLTMFQYLMKSKFSLPTTLSLLLDTIRWRLLNRVDSIRVSTVSHDFLNKPLVYFYKSDKLGRPLLIIHFSYLPDIPDDDDNDDDYLTPLVIFVLETARLLILSESNVFDINVLLDFKNTTTIPFDIKSLSSFISRYPGIIGSVNILNSSWIYQGLWKMYKMVLSNEAKSKMNIPTAKDLLNMIDSENLLQEFGGTDTFTWELDQDIYFTRYRPDIEPILLSRCSSSASIYYDVEPTEIHVQIAPSVSTISPSLTPVASHTNLTNLAKAYSSLSLSSKIGNGVPPRLRNTIKHLFVPAFPIETTTSEQQPSPSQPPPTPAYIRWFRAFYNKLETNVRSILVRSLQRFVKYKGTLYWIIAGVLLRNGVQELCQHILLMIMEVVFIGQPSAVGNAVGMRKMLSLTIGQLTL